MSHSHRVDWWLPLAIEPGEWAGRWDLAACAAEARTIAAGALADGAVHGLALVTLLGPGGARAGRAVADAAALDRWSVEAEPLPVSEIDPASLPPLGREDVGSRAVARCREALLAARDVGLLETVMVTAVIEIVQQALSGTGPAAEVAASIGGTAIPGCDP